MDIPTLLVHLDNPDNGHVSFKVKGLKGARWRKAQGIYHACAIADDEKIPSPRLIEYVTRRD